jgi:hypothetical protein
MLEGNILGLCDSMYFSFTVSSDLVFHQTSGLEQGVGATDLLVFQRVSWFPHLHLNVGLGTGPNGVLIRKNSILLALMLALFPGQQYQFQYSGWGKPGMHLVLLAVSFAVSCEQMALATNKQTNKKQDANNPKQQSKPVKMSCVGIM